MTLHTKRNADLQPLNTLSVPSTAAHLIELTDRQQLPLIRAWLRETELPHLVLGDGSNVVLPPLFDGLVILNRLSQWSQQEDLLTLGAGLSWHNSVMRTCDEGWFGLENLALIPGRVGAAPIQNIGAYGVEFSDICVSVEVFDLHTGQTRALSPEACQFAYRHSLFKTAAGEGLLVTAVTVRLRRDSPVLTYRPLRERFEQTPHQELSSTEIAQAVCEIRNSKLPNPSIIPNAGSFFKNPIVSSDTAQRLLRQYPQMPHWPVANNVKLAAGWLLDQAGCRGIERNGVGTAATQALVLTNVGHRPQQDIRHFADFLRHEVYHRFGIALEPEPSFVHTDGQSNTIPRR